MQCPNPAPCRCTCRSAKLLIRDIAAGRLVDGERAAARTRHGAGLGIAVGTLRKALETWQAKGLLVRVQGSGNYIRARADAESVYALLPAGTGRGRRAAHGRVLSVDRLPKDPRLPAFGTSPPRATASAACASCPGRSRRSRKSGSTPATRAHLRPRTCRIRSICSTARGWACGSPGPRTGWARAPLPDWAPPAFPHAPARPCRKSPASAGRRTAPRSRPRWTWFDPDACAMWRA
jgi:GntR family transcriptional regulator